MADTPVILREPLEGRAVWRGPDLEPADWLYELDAAEKAELARLRADLVSRGVGLGAIDPESTPLPALADTIAGWFDRVENGIGFVAIRGLDISGWSEREVGLVYYALGRQAGRPVKQNAAGHLLGHVRDTGRDIFTDPNARGYQVKIALPFHTDTSTDVLSLCCYRTAKEGGVSALAPLQTRDGIGRSFRFHCKYRYAGSTCNDGRSADQTTATQWGDDLIQRGYFLDQFQSCGTLTGNDIG